MKLHRTDLVSLAFGLIFIGLSVWWLLAHILGLALPPVGWFLAGGLLLIGLLGLVGALRSAGHNDREPSATAAGAGPDATGPAGGTATGYDGDPTREGPPVPGDGGPPDPAVGWPAPLDDAHPDTHRFHAPDAADVHVEGPASSPAPVWGPDARPGGPDTPYRPAGEADEWSEAVGDLPTEAVEDRPADAPYPLPDVGVPIRPPADRGDGETPHHRPPGPVAER